MPATTKQNTSTAVMQNRLEPADSLDYFPTQPWAVRAACEWLRDELGEPIDKHTCWEPACGEGFMVKPLREYFASVRASDVIAYPPFEHELIDFVGYAVWAKRDAVDWIFTNPPFALAEQFIKRARRLARKGVVMVVRSAFTEGGDRYDQLFTGDNRPSHVVTYAQRVVMLRNRLIKDGSPDPFNYDPTTYQPARARSATAYSLVVWRPGEHDTRHRWIGRVRDSLTRDDDYPAYAEQHALLRKLRLEATGQEEFAI